MGYKLQFLGVGSAFTMKGFQSNLLLWDEDSKDSKLLLDCGGDIRHSLAAAGGRAEEIDGVYISHLHADHVSGLEWLAFNTFFNPNIEKPKLYIDRGLREPLWRAVGEGLRSLNQDIADLDTYFDVHAVSKRFEWSDIIFRIVKLIHVSNGFDDMHSYGLSFVIGDQEIFWTSDTAVHEDLLWPRWHSADVIFQDCELGPRTSGVHFPYSRLRELPKDIKEKMHLYHLADVDLPDAKKDGFAGFVEQGQVFSFEK
jgi:ribonuclease BN (tRNA processing enzyme)